MGLKWFRARLKMKRKHKNTSGSVAGFYRPMSQFDTDLQPNQSSFVQEPPTVRAEQPVGSILETIAHNPMAGLNYQKIETPVVPEDIVSTAREQLEMRKDKEINTNEELESPDVDVPKHLPRESIDIMRDANAEGTFHRTGSRSRKMDFKRKKARAPIPKIAANSDAGDEKFYMFGKDRKSDASEIEI